MSILNTIHTKISKINRSVETIITKFHRSYLVLVCLLAIMGYILVLLPPFMIIVACVNIFEILSMGDIANWQRGLIWLTILIISTLFTYRSSQIKISPPTGLNVLEEKLPEIFKLTQQFISHFKKPVIERIVITSNYELDIVKVPKFALPIWSMNTLVIGLPVLLCHAPKEFECMVARRIGQFSKRSNPISNWAYQLRAVWKQYHLAYSKQKFPDSIILKWIYGAYANLYSLISTYSARRDELNADTYAMELFSHEDVRKMITADATYQWFLKELYWPAINKKAAAKIKSPLTPYKNITGTINANLKEEKLQFVIEKAFKAKLHVHDPAAPMQQRLTNVGHDTPSLSVRTGDTAAVKYLGDSLNNVIGLIDKLWLNNNNIRSHKNNKK